MNHEKIGKHFWPLISPSAKNGILQQSEFLNFFDFSDPQKYDLNSSHSLEDQTRLGTQISAVDLSWILKYFQKSLEPKKIFIFIFVGPICKIWTVHIL